MGSVVQKGAARGGGWKLGANELYPATAETRVQTAAGPLIRMILRARAFSMVRAVSMNGRGLSPLPGLALPFLAIAFRIRRIFANFPNVVGHIPRNRQGVGEVFLDVFHTHAAIENDVTGDDKG